MQRFVRGIREVDWVQFRRDAHNTFTKLIRTRDPWDSETQSVTVPRQRLSRCLTTMDLTSLGVGSCVGTGMYLVAGMVAQKYAGPGVALSFIIAAVASIFSGVCYAEFGVRVPNTTGSAYMYSYVTVGEFLAFIIGWNMVLEYLIGTSACARALSACFDSLCDGAIERSTAKNVGTIFGKPPDFLAFGITLLMTMILVAGVKKSLFFNNVLNAINLSIWVFIVTAGVFYIDVTNWTEHKGFLPYGWSGVFSGAATCFYAFIGFDIIATTGEEANNPKRSIPLAIVLSLGIILLAYVSTSIILTLIVPYDRVNTDSALVQMFAYVDAPTCKYIVALGALAGLTVSMFGSMFPMPRVVYAMAQDGLIFKQLGVVSEKTGSPSFATICGGICAALVSLVVQLEVLVEMMSIGTLLAYTLVSTCVLVLRYQPHSTNLIELLPQSLRTPVDPVAGTSSQRETNFAVSIIHFIYHNYLRFYMLQVTSQTQIMPPSQRVMVRRVSRSSPDSDDTIAGDDSEEYGRDDTFLMNPHAENKFYGAVPGGSSIGSTRCGRFFDAIYRQLHVMSYLCPGILPWVDCGPATEASGMFVIKSVGVLYVFVIIFDLFAAYGSPSTSTFTTVVMVLLFLGIITILLLISRKPQNRSSLVYHAPCLPFVPGVAIITNIYLILNLSVLTLVRFTIWMSLGLIMYFKYGIKNSTLETNFLAPPATTPPQQNPLDRTTLPPPSASQPVPIGDRNIFEGDGNNRMFGSYEYSDPVLTWHVTDLEPLPSSSRGTSMKQVESRSICVSEHITTDIEAGR
ncbi:solute carrier family 7 member 14 [Battus philenor]|uniref:solute carrier family 7 member 14 n=1 Tax=Battus philenor TaxID=42288 RepID=UPI0035CF9880